MTRFHKGKVMELVQAGVTDFFGDWVHVKALEVLDLSMGNSSSWARFSM